jgi:hypothetical protein
MQLFVFLNLDNSTKSADLKELFAMLSYYFDVQGLSFSVVVLVGFLFFMFPT